LRLKHQLKGTDISKEFDEASVKDARSKREMYQGRVVMVVGNLELVNDGLRINLNTFYL
jgi:hypothetical protein